jgi:hypothetical protein
MNDLSAAESAAELIGFGLRSGQLPHRDPTYRELIARYSRDDVFAALVVAIAEGLGLQVLDVGHVTGIVLAAIPGSVFEIKMDDYAKGTRVQSREAEKVLHGVVHLAIAALCFPRPDDLADDFYVGRVSVEHIDQAVRDICRALDLRTGREAGNTDPVSDQPELEKAWRAYRQRHQVASTKDGRRNSASTHGMITRALKWLADRGMLRAVGEESEAVFQTTARYQVQVRQLASQATFQELLALGALPSSEYPGDLHV